MGIIVKHVESDKIIFYLKGADVVIKSLVVESKRGYIDEECDNLSREGLRTLVIT
jgi:phospholipid-translocating ATPase